ncbi:MAG: hypothetical protein KIT84_29255 [Labilithrix sp.]|nr:hypothetical protein [Labilithrix sp.]MCW5815150.1 hypothetical protein [Labilithrix sp.]
MRRTSALAFVVLGAVACGGASADVAAPTTAVAPPAAAPPPSQPSPAPPPTIQEPTGLATPPPPEVQAKQGEATKDPNEDTMRTAAEVEARANAEQLAKDRAKWEKMGREIERKAAYEDAHDRLTRASARVAQTQTQLSRIPPARRGKYNTDMATFGSKKAAVQSRMSSIHAYGSDEWQRMRGELYRALDELDAAATRVEMNLF